MGRSGKLSARTVPVAALTPVERDAMWALYAAHYEGVTRQAFERDLDAKRDAILAHDRGDGSIQGFSTQTWARSRHDGRSFITLFSGDTIVAPEYWGQPALQNAFGVYMTRLKLRHPLTPTYWFLVSKGYKTYLLLTRNFPQHWPRHDRTMPKWERGALDALCRARFGAAWQPDEGVIRLGEDAPRLRAGVAPLDDGLVATAQDVRFFLRANPGHAHGDELACLARIGLGIWARYLAKQARRRAARVGRRRRWAAS